MAIDAEWQSGLFSELMGMDGWPARAEQRLKLLKADSHDPESLSVVREWFDGPLDFLFLDGDHTYEGVKQDWETFSPLVRAGGMVGFHDVGNPQLSGVSRFFAESIIGKHVCGMYGGVPGVGVGAVWL
jgi:hypothetical protein